MTQGEVLRDRLTCGCGRDCQPSPGGRWWEEEIEKLGSDPIIMKADNPSRSHLLLAMRKIWSVWPQSLIICSSCSCLGGRGLEEELSLHSSRLLPRTVPWIVPGSRLLPRPGHVWELWRGGAETSQSGRASKISAGKILIGDSRHNPDASRSDQPQHSTNNRSSDVLPCAVLFSGEPPFSEQHIVLVWDLGNPEASLFFGGSGQKGAKSSCYLEVGVIPLHWKICQTRITHMGESIKRVICLEVLKIIWSRVSRHQVIFRGPPL